MKLVPLDQWVAKTKRLLLQERDEEIQTVQEELTTLSDSENPNVLVNLRLVSFSTALFGRKMVKLVFPSHHLQRPKPHAFTVGDLVQIRMKSPNEEGSVYPTGIVARVEETAISIALGGGDGDDIDEEQLLLGAGGGGSGITIDRLANNATFTKITSALDRMAKFDYGHAESVVDVVFNGTPPRWQTPFPSITPFNDGLNDSQVDAIRFALASKDLALIHGPPGTGKTTTVVELIRQAVETFHMKVLVCAPSNIAVDNVLEKLAATTKDNTNSKKLQLTRVGHPARLLPEILPYCLDARIQSAEGTEIVNDIRKEMLQMESQVRKTKDKSVKYQLRKDLKANRKEIRQREQKVVVQLLQQSDVVFATTVGAASKLLKDMVFDLVVIDEAAQALEASCWIPIRMAKRCVLAGDHCQLPPTIKSKEAAVKGLETTLFDRITQFEHTQETIVKMLRIQYRMHHDISDWSSKAMYKGELQSFEGVAHRKLNQLDHVTIDGDDEWVLNATLLLVDTAGCDLEEDADPENDEDAKQKQKKKQQSKSNEGEARIVAKHVQALLKSGLRTNEIAVITPYNKQVQLLKSLLLDTYPTLEIRSVDGFQGCEKEAVVMSLVRSNKARQVGFLADERRMNVALTRAKRHVAVVCDTDTIRKNAFLNKMVLHFEEFGEFKSAHDYLEQDVVHGESSAATAAAIPSTTTSVNVAKKPEAKKQPASKKKKTVESTIMVKGEGSAVDAKTARAGTNTDAKLAVGFAAVAVSGVASQEKAEVVLVSKATPSEKKAGKTLIKEAENEIDDQDEDRDEEEDEDEPPPRDTTPVTKKSAFQMLSDSDSSSESEDEEKHAIPANDELNSAASLLRDLHLSRLARQLPPAVPTTSGGGGGSNKKNKKKKKTKSKNNGGSTANGGTASVDTVREDEDELAFLTRQADQSNRCCFQPTRTTTTTAPRCKKSVSMLGTVCKLCKLKFCYDHAQPEIHGCGDAIRKLERHQFQAKMASGATAPKLTMDKRKLLQKKLDDKVRDQTAARQVQKKKANK